MADLPYKEKRNVKNSNVALIAANQAVSRYYVQYKFIVYANSC